MLDTERERVVEEEDRGGEANEQLLTFAKTCSRG